MQFFQSISALILVCSLAFAATACGGESPAESTKATSTEMPHGEGKEYTSAYVCPMHCDDSGSDSAGECPVCGMNYVANADHTHDGHNH
jgi:hypothetical protein